MPVAALIKFLDLDGSTIWHLQRIHEAEIRANYLASVTFKQLDHSN